MDAADILIQLEDHLRPLVASLKGQVEVMDMEADVLAKLGLAPEGWRVMLCADNAESVEPQDLGGWVDFGIAAWVQQPKGLPLAPGKGIHRAGTSGSLPFLSRLALVMQWTRGLALDHPEAQGCPRIFRFRKWEWVRMEDGATLRAAKITFTVTHALNDPDGSLGFAVADGYLYVQTSGGVVRRARLLTFAGEPPATLGVDASGLALFCAEATLYVAAGGAAKRVRLLALPEDVQAPDVLPLPQCGLTWAVANGYLYVGDGNEIRRVRVRDN